MGTLITNHLIRLMAAIFMASKMIPRIASILGILFSALVATAPPSFAQQSQPVKISIDMWIGFGPLVVGKKKGLFEKRGVNVELVVITGTGEKNAAMAAKHVQGRAEGLESIVLAANQGVPGTVVLALDESAGGDGIVASRSIQSIADLKGKRVGFQTGLPGHFFLLYMLHKAGLTEKRHLTTDHGLCLGCQRIYCRQVRRSSYVGAMAFTSS